MVRFPKVTRLAAAALLTVAAIGFTSGVSSAQPSGSLTDNGDNTVTLNYDGGDAPWVLVFLAPGTACPTGTVPFPDVYPIAEYATGEPVLGLAPVLIDEGVSVLDFSGGLEPVETLLPAGDYQLCLYAIGGSGVALVYITALAASIGAPEPTTTTTVAPTTTTVPAAEPVTPRYTG
jgi:hypothetical protein